MDEVQVRLIGCFAAVFPALTQEQILRADHYNVSRWDSVASVTLFATIEEEFGVEVDLQDLAGLVSFETILGYLTSNTTA
jgi:acyl carrier protein